MTGVFVVLAAFFLANAVFESQERVSDAELRHSITRTFVELIVASLCGGLAWWCR